METNREKVFSLWDLVKEFNGKQVLSIPRLSFEKGEIYCLYGANGSGKTTLFELLTLLQKPTRGKIYFHGQEVFPGGDGFARLRQSVTLVHQSPLLFDTTVHKNVDYGLRLRKVPQRERKKMVRECLKIVGLEHFDKRKARELSGGEAQRVAIARALCISPEVLLLDEFSANIDHENRLITEDLIALINRRFGTTIIFTTHYMDQAYRLSAHVIHLYRGKVVDAQIRNVFRGFISIKDEGALFKNEKIKLFVSTDVLGAATISIPLNAIILSRAPLDSSMLNCLQGRIVTIMDQDKSVLLKVFAGDFLEVLITKESFRRMGLEPGTEVYANFKASAVNVL